MTDNQSESLAKFRELFNKFDNAMLVSSDERGQPHGRPMRVAAHNQDTIDDLWFVTSRDAGKIEEIREEPRVAVIMADDKRFLSVSGHATVVIDRAKIDAMWTDAWKIWFPDGPASEDIALIQVRPIRGEYWDQSFPNGARFAFEALKARLKDQPIDIPDEPEQHAKVNLAARARPTRRARLT